MFNECIYYLTRKILVLGVKIITLGSTDIVRG